MKNLSVINPTEIPTDFDLIEMESPTTLREFYELIAKTLEFPDYFGFNLDSFDEMINDLSWMENEKLFLYFKNSENFLKNERNETKIQTLLDLLEATCEEWKWEEEEGKEILIGFSPSERMERLLSIEL
ncbi:Barstar (barnase inhibitor) [Leadbetterella byssophila DSM 17132]|uniref:Barstar (Barnase inhibitor) n=1 Tax=Leadbetterella byssophila (strain DSM 17132 / JCM 16389 / KACC 11308 / NBRC 106382 / 4M15) TaxID=649349 RepID=E4RRS7_LEAB4|nr:barstar family protein [Leadbetterella byssophila]ADQ17614.1 Barstar (barnase inhibitor) [Leadbetterella byssophila DSM 17132]